MDMNVGDAVLTAEADQAKRFFFTGRELGDRLVFALSDRENNRGCLPHYIAVGPSEALTSSGLMPVAALGVICDFGTQAKLMIDHGGGARGTLVPPTLHCPKADSYLRPADLAYYRPFLVGLVR